MLKESLTGLVRTHTGWRMESREVEVRSQGKKSLCLAQLQPEQTQKLAATAPAAVPRRRSGISRPSPAQVRQYPEDADGPGRARLPDPGHMCKTASSGAGQGQRPEPTTSPPLSLAPDISSARSQLLENTYLLKILPRL